MNRRNFLKAVAASGCVARAIDERPLNAQESLATSMGVVQYSFSDGPHTRSAVSSSSTATRSGRAESRSSSIRLTPAISISCSGVPPSSACISS